MKKSLVVLGFIAIAVACNSNKQTEVAEKESVSKKDPEVQKGLELVAKSDCFTCHQVLEKGIGPAYKAVANKYEYSDELVSVLAQKIITGGSGNWGPVAMTPHQELSKADAEVMVKYIFSLKDK